MFQGDLGKYCSAMREAVQQLWSAECEKTQERLRLMEENSSTLPLREQRSTPDTPDSLNTHLDTLVFPTLQMGPFGITNDGYVTKRFLSSAEEASRIHLASGYFNLTEEYMKCVLGESRASYSILMAHPEVRKSHLCKHIHDCIHLLNTQTISFRIPIVVITAFITF